MYYNITLWFNIIWQQPRAARSHGCPKLPLKAPGLRTRGSPICPQQRHPSEIRTRPGRVPESLGSDLADWAAKPRDAERAAEMHVQRCALRLEVATPVWRFGTSRLDFAVRACAALAEEPGSHVGRIVVGLS